MYNGIGLRTVRGTATNGFVQRNLSYVKPAMVRAKTGKSDQDWGSAIPKARKACAEIQAHDRKRQIEVKLLEFQEELEAKGFSESEIEARLELKREELTKELERRENVAAESPVATVGAVLADKGAGSDSWRAAQHLPAPGTSGVKTYMDRKLDGQEEYYPGVERDRARRERLEKRRLDDQQREEAGKDRQRPVDRRDHEREDRQRVGRDDRGDRRRSRSRDRSRREGGRADDRKSTDGRDERSRDRKRSRSRDRRRHRSPSTSSSSSSESSSSGTSSGSSSSSRTSSSRSRSSSSRRRRRDRR